MLDLTESDIDAVDQMIKKTGCFEFHEKVQVNNLPNSLLC